MDSPAATSASTSVSRCVSRLEPVHAGQADVEQDDVRPQLGDHPDVGLVGLLTLFGLLGPLVGYAGRARAGVVSWWPLVPAVLVLVLWRR